MNNKGFAITGFIYTILILFIALLISILALLNSRKNVLDKLKEKVRGEVDITSVVKYEPFVESGDVIEFVAKAQGYYKFMMSSPKINTYNGSYAEFNLYLYKGESLKFLIGSSTYNNGITEIRSKTNELIAKVSYSTSTIINSYDNRIIVEKKIKENNNTLSGKIEVKYINETRKNEDLNKVKYIKDCVSSLYEWSSIKAISGGIDVALNKNVSNNFKYVVDGSDDTKNTLEGTGEQCIIVDLGRTYNLDYIQVNHGKDKIYYGNKIEVSSDGKSYTRISNYEKKEDVNGILVSAFAQRQVLKVGDIYVPVKNFEDATWIRVFHHNNLNGQILWDADLQVTLASGYDQLHKQSILYALENYKNKNNTFEFLLEYSDIDGYNRWIQKSNPINSTSVLGYVPVSISWNNSGWEGLAKSSSNYATIDGTSNVNAHDYSIGATKSYNGGVLANGTISKEITDLWVRIDNIY